MAPKKKPQKHNSKPSSSSSSSSSSLKSSKRQSSSGPRLEISAENEDRLRRLLLNSGRGAPPAPSPEHSNHSKAQKAKKLRAVYEKLSCEGFSNDQIELALSALKDGATFEAALDWLCLNLPSNELPLKFSSGSSQYSGGGGSVGVISIARNDWTTSEDESAKIDEEHRIRVQIKEQKDEDTLGSCQPSQADWIRQYMMQQEEEEPESWEDEMVDGGSHRKVATSRSPDVIVKEYFAVRAEASKAKEKKDKEAQQLAGNKIRRLKQEMSALGLSEEMLALEFEREDARNSNSEDTHNNLKPDDCSQSTVLGDFGSDPALTDQLNEPTKGEYSVESCSANEVPGEPHSISLPGTELSEDVELGGMFCEDVTSVEALPSQILEFQKQETLRELWSEKNLEKLDGIWKKGDAKKIPKAFLHQLCRKAGWEAPKFNKVHGKGKTFFYSVSILRKPSGRGKNKKVGGLITLQLPNKDETFESSEDAQNRVAAFALHELFADLPAQLAITEPYASLVVMWKQGESSTSIGGEEDRRVEFVDRLLDMDGSSSLPSLDVPESPLPGPSEMPYPGEEESPNNAYARKEAERDSAREKESFFLREEQERKQSMQKYKDMLRTRASLPVAGLRGDILQLLKDNNVLVVCGETGSGKTTQVPQFILDNMIKSGHGGYCNIICTQPRRIAAISVAQRVADERCESAPGSDGSLVGYQVRLESARNEKTKLLFCTTGILLRKLAGDKNLSGVTHVIVDEVHERSLLGDFLLIILKNLVEKQSEHSTSKLKVILMSATIDANLFSRYFGNCPVITAKGRTHPVTTYYLEDIYEIINYHLAHDSPAYLRSEASRDYMHGSVNNRRGKKNLVLSGWGDESILSEDCLNPYYDSTNYNSYSKQTQQNLKKLNEDVIDYDLLEELVYHIHETCEEGSILVFLPGVSEIYMLLDRLAASYRFGGPSSDWLLPLHSSIASNEQKKVFLHPPDGIRKIVIATNIAETSITIDDVVYVIDSGKHKENRYNPQKKLSSMVEDWIAQANARQRRGRAGRVKPGTCFCLFTCHRFEKLMRPYQVPEMLRMPLVELCLQIKLLGLGHIKPILSKALEAPKEGAITSAISLLIEVGAIDGDEELTPLGHHLAKLPVDVLIGKMLIYGGIFGCLSPILSIAAFLSYKSPFVYPKDEKQCVERAKHALLTDKVDGPNGSVDMDRQSDHLLMMVVYKKWERIMRENGYKAAKKFCESYFLSSSVLNLIRDMRLQFGALLADIGLINLPRSYQGVGKKKDNLDWWLSDESQPFNAYARHPEILKAILCAGLYPNVAATEEGITGAALNSLKGSNGPASRAHPVWYDGRREVHIHPSSVNSSLKSFQHPFLVFLEKVETNKVFLRDTTVVSPFSILLFGGSINVQHQTGTVTIDGWLKLTAPAQTAVLFKELRLTLYSILKDLIRRPERASIVHDEVVKSMVGLLLEEGKSSR